MTEFLLLTTIAGASVFGFLCAGGLRFESGVLGGLCALAVVAGAAEIVLIERRRRHPGRSTAIEPERAAVEREILEDGGASGVAESLAVVLGEVGISLVVTDMIGIVRHAGPAAAALLEHDTSEVWAATHPDFSFFGLPVENAEQLATLRGFLASEDEAAHGVVTLAGSHRQVSWASRTLTGVEGLGLGRAFVMRDVTNERRFDVLKSDFLGTLSHELRTPLTSLRGSLQLVLSRAETLNPMDRHLLEIGVKNTERLVRLITDLLDVGALEQGSLQFHFSTLEIDGVIRAALNTVRGAFAARQLNIDVECPADLPVVQGDRERLVQVVVNLLSNAAKYAPIGSTVRLAARSCEAGLQVDVEDHGPGISGLEQAHVFERFWRADRAGVDSGPGLGLAICRAVIARHGGEIWVDSEEGQRTTFSFFLPRSIFRVESSVPFDSMPTDRKIAVLLVEDDSDARAVLRTALERCGYEVLEAPSGATGVAIARRRRPAAVVLDLLLPDINGYDVLRILKNSPETMEVPIVALSVEPERELARRLGAVDVLQKPVDFEAVRYSLSRALRYAGRESSRLVLGLAPAVSRDLSVLASALASDGHQIYRASDVADLGHWAQANYPDALILDDDFLPQAPAEAARVLEEILAEQSTPVVALTTRSVTGNNVAAWVPVRKPISKDDFIATVHRLLEGKPREATGPATAAALRDA